jgi:hypothetical protein
MANVDPAKFDMPTIPHSGVSATPATSVRSHLLKALLHAGNICVAAAAFVAYEHFKLHGQSTQSLVSLLVSAGFGLAPVRALLNAFLEIEGKVMHLVHGLGGLAFCGLALGGFVSGGPLLTHAALAPFSIMGAAQALMHQEHPRTPEQAQALRRFVESLPEVEQFARAGNLSPENAQRAMVALTDIVSKAQALGETELKSDPGFQGALRQVTTRLGLSLGLDAVDRSMVELSKNPAAASALPELRTRLAKARNTLTQ